MDYDEITIKLNLEQQKRLKALAKILCCHDAEVLFKILFNKACRIVELQAHGKKICAVPTWEAKDNYEDLSF